MHSTSASKASRSCTWSPTRKSSSGSIRSSDRATSRKEDFMPGPLQGIRVLDCTVALAGPFCGLLLADLGADVIKIENPDPKERTAGGLAAYKGENGHFLIANRNKRGCAVNLKDERGREMFYRLVETADVLVQNFRPGVMKRLGCDYETLRQINPRLIY